MGQEAQGKPSCFSTVRWYARWEASNLKCGSGHQAASVCADCLPSYQRVMRLAGRCDNPATVFAFDKDGAIVGVAA